MGAASLFLCDLTDADDSASVDLFDVLRLAS